MAPVGGHFQWGAFHGIPITLPLPPLGPFNWRQRKLPGEMVFAGNSFAHGIRCSKTDTTIKKFLYKNVSFGLSASTALYGTAQFGQHSRVIAIRHTMRPTVSVNYKPDMMKFLLQYR
jgi:hypothetical protein